MAHADGVPLVVQIIVGVLLLIATLIWMSAWRRGLNRKVVYLFLTFGVLTWSSYLQELFVLVGVPQVWQDGVFAVSVMLVAGALVLLYRHRHDPDPEEI